MLMILVGNGRWKMLISWLEIINILVYSVIWIGICKCVRIDGVKLCNVNDMRNFDGKFY